MASGRTEESTVVLDNDPPWKKELLLRKKLSVSGNASLRLSGRKNVDESRSSKTMRFYGDDGTTRMVDNLSTSRIAAKLRSKYSTRRHDSNGKESSDNNSDSSEELQYGPGIVNKLRSKYLSMTLRDNQRYSRPSLNQLRRATSLENMLDDEFRPQIKSHFVKKPNLPNKNGKSFQHRAKYLGNSNESMKRARSMDTLFNKEPRVLRPNGMTQSVIANEDLVIVDKDEETSNKSVVTDDRELPPPDVVKQTKKLFENPYNSSSIDRRNNKKGVANKMNVKIGSVFDKRVEKTIKPKPSLSPKPVLSQESKSTHWSSKKVYPLVTSTSKPLNSKTTNSLRQNVDVPLPPLGKPVLLPLASSSPSRPPFVSVKPNLSGDNSPLLSPQLLSPNSVKIVEDVERSTANSPSKDPGSPISKFYSDSSLSSCFPRRNLMQATNSCLVKSQTTESTSVKQVAVIRPIPAKKPLTEQEVENNLINSVKNLKKVSAEENKTEGTNVEVDQAAQSWAKKSWQNTNTMVFNFSSRPTVPDYIENDGLNIAKRIPPKASNCKDEVDMDEEWDSSLLCEVSFVGDNVVINGKSNLRKDASAIKVPAKRIQFNDEATTLHEYPSEDSLIQEPSVTEVSSPCSSPLPPSPTSPSPLLSSAALASYTPSKSATPTGFELGITSTSSVLPHVQHSISQPQQSDEYLKPVDICHETAWSQETTADILF